MDFLCCEPFFIKKKARDVEKNGHATVRDNITTSVANLLACFGIVLKTLMGGGAASE